jgi:dolichol-phosphate mannosyltransferase
MPPQTSHLSVEPRAAPEGEPDPAALYDVSVIIPTYREAENLPLLVPRIAAALHQAGLRGEIVIVDDNSQDGTEMLCKELALSYPVRLLVRTGQRGLAGAVLHGLRQATGAVLAVMDADLSHPPELIPAIVAAIRSGQADFAIGSRYVAGGQTDEDWGWFRRFNSSVATLLARPLTPVADPFAGFFALARDRFAAASPLDPIGYKICLELLVKCDCRRIAEIPIRFQDRRHGRSKLSLREQFNYLRHLGRLYWYRFGLGEQASPSV